MKHSTQGLPRALLCLAAILLTSVLFTGNALTQLIQTETTKNTYLEHMTNIYKFHKCHCLTAFWFSATLTTRLHLLSQLHVVYTKVLWLRCVPIQLKTQSVVCICNSSSGVWSMAEQIAALSHCLLAVTLVTDEQGTRPGAAVVRPEAVHLSSAAQNVEIINSFT